MNKVMFFLFGFFSFALIMNLVSAETIVFDYSSASSSTGVVNNGNGQYTWTVPSGVSSVDVKVWSGGGGGGPGPEYFDTWGGGGGGLVTATVPVTAGNIFTVNVGGGGGVNVNGGNSLFTKQGGAMSIVVKGGLAGGLSGSTGGTLLSSSGIVQPIVYAGGNGGGFGTGGGAVFYCSGGGGGGGGTGGVGTSWAGGCEGGNGDGLASLGGGAAAQYGCVPGTVPGGGGGGKTPCGCTSSGCGIASAGAPGRIILTYTINSIVNPICGSNGCEVGETPANCPLDCSSASSEINTCSSPNQIIFSLYQSNNSHVALWNNESAGYKVCYNQIFGREYAVNNMRVCTGKNSVLNISSIDNAHAEKPYGLNYPVGICYGEMACSVRTARCNPGGEKIVARLSGETNAHVSNSSFPSYDNLLCCSEKPLGFNRLSWKDSSETNFISNAKNGDSVVLYAVTNFTAGTLVTFEIYEDDPLSRDNIRTGSNNLSGIVDSNGIAKASWTITQADIDAGDGLGEGDFVEFYSFANVNGFYNKISDELITNKNRDTVIPANCNIDIITGVGKLNHRGIYFANKSIEFNQSRVSESNINVQWVIEGENEARIVNNEKSFVMNFSRAGQKTITLNANIPGCAEQNRQVSILVTDGPGLFTFINAPFHMQVFKFASDTISVYYSGNESYVVNVLPVVGDNCAKTINCLAGNCPSSTSNIPEGCSSPPNNLPVTLNGASDKFANLNFTWSKIKRVGEDTLTKGHGEVNASGYTNYNRANDRSKAIGDKQIKLIANYTVGTVSLQNTFLRNFTLGTCINNGYQRLNIDSLGRVKNITNTRESGIACGNSGDGICCPVGEVCGVNGCERTENPITTCSNYTLRDYCLSDPYSAKEFEYSSFVQRNGLSPECNVNYNCVWNQTACNFNITQVDNLGNFGGSCLESAIPVVDSSCDNGELTKLINITSTSSGQLACLTCQSGVFEVPCGRPSIELPFFGIQQIVLSLISIIGVYLFMFRRKKVN